MMAKTKNLVPLFVILASFLIFNLVNSAENNIDLSLFHLWNSICLGPETNQLWNCPEESSMCTEKEQGWLDTLNVNLLEGHAKNPLELFDCLDNLNGKIRLYYKCNSYIPGGFPVFGWTDSWWFGNSAWKYLYEPDSLWCWISGSRTDTTYVDSTLRYAYRECASKSSFGGYYVAHEFNVDNPRAESLYYHGWDYMIHYAESLDSDLSHVKAVASAVAGTRHHTDPELTRIADSLDVFDAYHYVFAETTDLVQASPETQLPLDNLAFHYDTTRSFFKDSHTRWAAATQACACWRRRGGQITRNHRFPTREEIRVQAFMALLRGAKGIIQFSYASQWGDGDGELIFGLVNYKRNGKTRPWDDPLYYDYYDSPYDVEPFYHVAELYGDLQKLGPYFGRTYSTDVYAVADTQDVNGPIIRRIEGVYIDAGTFFDSTTADSTLYFMLVNRVCHADNNGTPADSQQVTVTIRAPDGLNSYLIKDMYTGQVTAIPQDSLDQNNDFEFTTVIPPGDGQLFLLKPAIRGIYNNDLTWSGTILIDGDIVFGGDPQPTLTVEPNTEIYFLADHDYYRTGGADSTKCELRV
jgi:hypothetical protein